jgi:trimeric autotransporter adhesin
MQKSVRSYAIVASLYLLISFLTACGGGSKTPTPTPVPSNPQPSVISLSPSSVTAGAAAFSLTVNGSSFINSSTVLWNGAARPTTYNSATSLTAAITAADVDTGADNSVTVSTPGPGGGTSTANHFMVNNPAPAIVSITPSPVKTTHVGSALQVTGTGFVRSSTILWNGNTRSTTFVSSTQLQTTITAADLTTLGAVNIGVRNVAPGGGDAPAAQVMLENAAPVLTSLSPSAVIYGGTGFTLSVNGSGFVPSSTVRWNGIARTTAFVSSTRLTIQLSDTDVANIGTAQVTVVTSAPGGGTSSPLTFTIADVPVPAIGSVTPNSVYAGSGDTLINAYGPYLQPNTVLQFDGVDLPTSMGPAFQLAATIPATSLQTVGSHSITAKTPGNPDKISNSVAFDVLSNPVPSIGTVSPAAAPVGSADVAITVSGLNLVPTSVVRFNGIALPTTTGYFSQLQATIPASVLTGFGNNQITIFTPAPGGGESSPLNFSTYLPLATNDLVYNSHDGKLLASVPSAGSPSLGNSVVTIDPYTGNVSNPIWVGSEPGKLALSDDGTTLWVALNGASSVRKVDLTTKTATSVQVYFAGDPHTGLVSFTDLAVMPGNPNTVAVGYSGVVTIVDGTVKRTNTGLGSYFVFGTSPNKLYSGGSYSGYSVLSIDSTGVASTTSFPVSNSGNGLKYDAGRVYGTSGVVIDADAGALLGTFSSSGPVAPDSSAGRAFILNNGTQYSNSFDRITAYDSTTLVPVGTLPISGITTDLYGGTTALVRFGQNGLAVRTPTQVYLMRSNLVRDLSSSAVNLALSVAAPGTATTGTNTIFSATIQNKSSNTATNVVLNDAIPNGATFVSSTPSQGTCVGSTIVRCNLGSIAGGASATVSFVVTPLTAGTAADSANVTSVEPDSDSSDNSATASVVLTGATYSAVPVISNLSPAAVVAGSNGFTLAVAGDGFSFGSVVKLGSTDLPTTYVSESELNATVDKTQIASLGWAPVSVSTPAPGGGTSNSLPLMVVQVISLDTSDIVFDPFTRKIWASIPSTATQVTGNSFVDIDPATGAIGTAINIGSEPSRLSLTENGQYLYTSLRGSKEIRRMDLTSKTPGTRFTATDYRSAPYAVDDLAAMPGNPDSIAASGYTSDVQVYDINGSTATKRGDGGFIYSGYFLGWTDPTHLFSYDSGISPSKIHRFNVGASSVTETDETNVTGFYGHFENYNGLLYSDGGGVADPSPAHPAPPQLVGRFAASGIVAIDGGARRAYYDTTSSYGYPPPPFGLLTFNMDTFKQNGYLQLPVASDWQTTHADLIRWGSDGLAMRLYNNYQSTPGTGEVVVIRGPIVTPEEQYANSTPSLGSLSPSSATMGSGNLWITVTGSGFVPGAVVFWNGQERSTTFVSATTLKVALPKTDFASAATGALTAKNPNSGVSGGVSFTVN